MSYILDMKRLKQGVEIHDKSKIFNGYTLFAPMWDTNAWLINMEGKIVHRWKMKNPPGVNGKLIPNGNLMWLGRGPNAIEELPGGATELVEVDWDGNEVWRYDDVYLHHDFAYLDNGNIMLLRFCEIPQDIQKNIKGGMSGSELKNGRMLGVSVREINRKKETLWEWNNYEHFDVDKDIDCPLANRIVWGYTNSIDVFSDGDVLLSIRHMNKVIRISKKTGDIIWSWGPEQFLGHQHDARVLDNGNVTIFDNGLHRCPPFFKADTPYEISNLETSRALEVNPKTNEIVWEYKDPTFTFYTQYCGSVQRLPNGNTLLCESVKGNFYEVTCDKEIVWKYVSPFAIPRPDYWGWTVSYNIFKIHRYGVDFKGFKGKELNPDNFELVIQENTGKFKEEEDINRRLGMAGY